MLRAEVARLRAGRQSHLATVRGEALRRYRSGEPARVVALSLGVAYSTVDKWTRVAGINRPRRRNEHHAAMLRRAVAAVADGWTIRAAARNYDLGYATLARHCRAQGVVSRWTTDRGQAKGSTARGRHSRRVAA